MNIESKIKEVADFASNFDLEDTRKAWDKKTDDVVEYCIRVSDAIRIAEEYAESKCKEQRELDSAAFAKWFNSYEDVRHETEVIVSLPLATDKEGE